MRRAGCQEVTVNAGKRSRSNTQNEPSYSNIKRPTLAEVNFLPNFPKGKYTSSLEQMRQTIVDEVKKTEKNLMHRSHRSMSSPPVNELLDLWPALKIESEVR